MTGCPHHGAGPHSTPVTPAPQPGLAAADRLLEEMRGEITRADSKASVLLAALSMTVGAVAGVLTGRGWSPARLTASSATAWWVGACVLGLALFALLMAVLPRYRHSEWVPGRPLSYFGDIRRAVARGQLHGALADTEAAALEGVAAALAVTSRIVHEKHRWIRTALAALCTGVPLVCTAMLTN